MKVYSVRFSDFKKFFNVENLNVQVGISKDLKIPKTQS